jgi:hypothetical protein
MAEEGQLQPNPWVLIRGLAGRLDVGLLAPVWEGDELIEARDAWAYSAWAQALREPRWTLGAVKGRYAADRYDVGYYSSGPTSLEGLGPLGVYFQVSEVECLVWLLLLDLEAQGLLGTRRYTCDVCEGDGVNALELLEYQSIWLSQQRPPRGYSHFRPVSGPVRPSQTTRAWVGECTACGGEGIREEPWALTWLCSLEQEVMTLEEPRDVPEEYRGIAVTGTVVQPGDEDACDALRELCGAQESPEEYGLVLADWMLEHPGEAPDGFPGLKCWLPLWQACVRRHGTQFVTLCEQREGTRVPVGVVARLALVEVMLDELEGDGQEIRNLLAEALVNIVGAITR